MKSLSSIALSLLLTHIPFSYAVQTETVTLVENPTSTFTLPQQSASAASFSISSSQTTFQTSRTTLSTSLFQATHTQPSYATVSSNGGGYSGYDGYSAEDGASGTDTGSFNLSKGGLIAIIVIVVAVAIFGIASIALYVVAKKRQWSMRQTLRRASRRLTGRSDHPRPRSQADRRKRSGIVAGSKSTVTAAHPPGHKRGLVVEIKDEEKGPLDYGTPPKTKKPRENTWIGRLWGNDWK